MQRSEAVRKLAKMLGKGFGYRVDPKALPREEREAAQVAMREAVKVRNELSERKDARRNALLQADEEFQALRAAHKVAADDVSKLQSMALRRKITVGISNSLFFHVKAEADSWEEIFEKLAEKE